MRQAPEPSCHLCERCDAVDALLLPLASKSNLMQCLPPRCFLCLVLPTSLLESYIGVGLCHCWFGALLYDSLLGAQAPGFEHFAAAQPGIRCGSKIPHGLLSLPWRTLAERKPKRNVSRYFLATLFGAALGVLAVTTVVGLNPF